MNAEDDEDSDVPWSELQLLSNDIPTSPVPESPLLQDESDDDDIPGILRLHITSFPVIRRHFTLGR